MVHPVLAALCAWHCGHLDIRVYPEQHRDEKACDICANQRTRRPSGPQQSDLSDVLTRGRAQGVSVWASAAPSPPPGREAAGPCSAPPLWAPQWTSGLEGSLKDRALIHMQERAGVVTLICLWTS